LLFYVFLPPLKIYEIFSHCLELDPTIQKCRRPIIDKASTAQHQLLSLARVVRYSLKKHVKSTSKTRRTITAISRTQQATTNV